MDLLAPWDVLARVSPGYPDRAALVFLVLLVPIWLYMSWYDMARLKIINGLVLLTFAIFLVLGPFVMPMGVYVGQLIQACVVLAIMLVLYAGGAMGGGDAKFIAAASPYFLREDLLLVSMIFCACGVAAFVTHRLFRVIGADRMAPLWSSWRAGKRFPLGFALGGVVSLYLALAAF
ncbi:MAG: prepilin peptidase [Pseudomonadota bacterium]